MGNRALVNYQSNQFQQALEILEDKSLQNSENYEIDVVKAACLSKSGKIQEATSILKQKMSKISEDSDIEKLNLAIAQLDLDSADTKKYNSSPAFIALSLAKSETDAE